MRAEKLWAEFCQKKNIDINTPYEAWAFCGGGKEGDVPPFHGYAEGEGNRSLEYWRDVHKRAFAHSLLECGVEFTDESKIICEKFSVEYVPNQSIDTDELLFIEPSMVYAEEILAYRQEMLEAGSIFDGCFSLKRHECLLLYLHSYRL